MNSIIKRVKAFFILLHADFHLYRAIRQADARHRRTGERFYVIPDRHHRLVSRTYSELKRMRKAGLFSNRATESAFIIESFYYTPNRFSLSLTPMQRKSKRRAWLNYVAQVRHLV